MKKLRFISCVIAGLLLCSVLAIAGQALTLRASGTVDQKWLDMVGLLNETNTYNVADIVWQNDYVYPQAKLLDTPITPKQYSRPDDPKVLTYTPQNIVGYDMTAQPNGTPVMSEAQITVLTHGLASTAAGTWSFGADQLIDKLVQEAGASNIYWAEFSAYTAYSLYDLTNATGYSGPSVADVDLDSDDFLNELSTSLNTSSHIILLFDAFEAQESNDNVYFQFNFMLSSVVKVVKDYNGGILPKVNLIGHSRGGLTNLQYALDHPELVASLVSLGTPYIGSVPAQAFGWDMFEQYDQIDGLADIVDKNVYKGYNDRWNDNFHLYSHINAFAIGGNATLGFIEAMRVNAIEKVNEKLNGRTVDGIRTEKTDKEIEKIQKETELKDAEDARKAGPTPLIPSQEEDQLEGEITVLEAKIAELGEILNYANMAAFMDGLEAAKYLGLLKGASAVLSIIFPPTYFIVRLALKNYLTNSLSFSPAKVDALMKMYDSELRYHSGYGKYVLNDDILVDLNSQLGKAKNGVPAYKGFAQRTKTFHDEGTIDPESKSLPIIHYLESEDPEIAGWVVEYVKLTQADFVYVPNGPNSYAVIGGKANITAGVITIPSEYKNKPVTEIGAQAFRDSFGGDESIHTVNIPETVTKIGSGAFEDCDKLQKILFSGSPNLEEIGDFTFAGCTSLEYFGSASKGYCVIPGTVNTIGAYAFLQCKFSYCTIPAATDDIGFGAFLLCESLTSFGPLSGPAYQVISGVLYENGFGGVPAKLICYPMGKTATSFTVPAGVTTIADYAFSLNAYLEYVDFKDVTDIGDYAFAGCTSLYGFDDGNVIYSGAYAFEDTLWYDTNQSDFVSVGLTLYKYQGTEESLALDQYKIIRENAFDGSNVSRIVIDSCVELIGYLAFYGAEQLADVEFAAAVPPSFGMVPFQIGLDSPYIYVPQGSVAAYHGAMGSWYPNRIFPLVTVYFDSDGTEPSPILTGKGRLVDLPPSEKEHYDFQYWCDEYQTPYPQVSLWDKTEDATLYAYFTPGEYQILYDTFASDHGAVTNPNPEYYTYGEELELLPAVHDAGGFGFGGWYDNPQRAGDPIEAIETGTGGFIALYAKWIGNGFDVSFDLNYNGAGVYAGRLLQYGSTWTYTVPQRSGYVFTGWFTKAAGGVCYGSASGLGAVWDILNHTTVLYAQWRLAEYTVKISAEDAEEGYVYWLMDEGFSETEGTVTYGAAFQCPGCLSYAFKNFDGIFEDRPTVPGHEFKYFYILEDEQIVPIGCWADLLSQGHNCSCESGMGCMCSGIPDLGDGASFTIYALYEPKAYTIVFEFLDDTDTLADVTFEDNIQYPSAAGWVIEYWVIKGTSDEFISPGWFYGQNELSGDTVTLVAVCRKQIKLYTGLNGSPVYTTAQVYYSASNYVAVQPSIYGYSLLGWYGGSNGAWDKYADAGGNGVKALTDPDITALYACWELLPDFAVTFVDSKFGKTVSKLYYNVETAALVLDNNGPSAVPGTVLQELGYRFDGWWYGGVKINYISAGLLNGSNPVGNVTLSAQWIGEALNYLITSNATYYSPTSSVLIVDYKNYGSALTQTITIPGGVEEITFKNCMTTANKYINIIIADRSDDLTIRLVYFKMVAAPTKEAIYGNSVGMELTIDMHNSSIVGGTYTGSYPYDHGCDAVAVACNLRITGIDSTICGGAGKMGTNGVDGVSNNDAVNGGNGGRGIVAVGNIVVFAMGITISGGAGGNGGNGGKGAQGSPGTDGATGKNGGTGGTGAWGGQGLWGGNGGIAIYGCGNVTIGSSGPIAYNFIAGGAGGNAGKGGAGGKGGKGGDGGPGAFLVTPGKGGNGGVGGNGGYGNSGGNGGKGIYCMGTLSLSSYGVSGGKGGNAGAGGAAGVGGDPGQGGKKYVGSGYADPGNTGAFGTAGSGGYAGTNGSPY